MDHYKTLGLTRNASKEEIKAAFRRCALDFHPDRHYQSTEAARDHAILRFKQASEAYEVLIDDGKRADYDRWGSRRASQGPFGGGGGRSSYYGDGGGRSSYYGGGGSGAPPRYEGTTAAVVEWDLVFKYLTSRRFALNVFYASALLCGVIVIERTGDTLWRMNNSGKSFEEAMESIGKTKVQEDDR